MEWSEVDQCGAERRKPKRNGERKEVAMNAVTRTTTATAGDSIPLFHGKTA